MAQIALLLDEDVRLVLAEVLRERGYDALHVVEIALRPVLWHMESRYFEVIGEIAGVEAIAIGRSIRDIARLRRRYGPGRWRKLKGTATVRLGSGAVRRAEIHWYEAHGIGRVKLKIKRFLD